MVIEYTFHNTWIAERLSRPGHLFVCYDGGMLSPHCGVIAGYHVEDEHRDILLVEDYGRSQMEGIADVARRVDGLLKAHGHHFFACEGIYSYGDPALANYGDDGDLWASTGRSVNMLDSMQSRDGYLPVGKLRQIFANRRNYRLNLLRRKLLRQARDGRPELIWLPNREADNWGCPMFHRGVAGGGYRWKRYPGGIRSREIEQNHPLCDIIDAYTYYLLEREALRFEPSGGDASQDLRRAVMR